MQAHHCMHDACTVNLALVLFECHRVPANKLSMQELNQSIGVKLMTSDFLEIFVS